MLDDNMRVKGSGVKALTIFTLIVCVSLTGCMGNDDDGEENKAEDLIKKVEVDPSSPTSNETVRIDLFLNEPFRTNKPKIQFISLFQINEELNEATQMEKENDKEFFIEAGPFNAPDQIWFIIYLFKGDEVITYNDTIDIGSIEYSTDLNIHVTYSEEGFSNSTSSNVTADIYYGDAIQGIHIHFYRIRLNPVDNEREGRFTDCTPVNYREQISPGHERVVMRESNIKPNCVYIMRFVLYNSTNLFSTPTIQINT